MEIPCELGVMTLPHATLFPQAMLPLYIFEPRYRRMLADALESHRMFVIAMQRPGSQRESPSKVAGLGMIRVSVQNKDGTSHLILHGLMRVQLEKTVRYKPYRMARIRPLMPERGDNVHVDALVARIRDLVSERVKMGFSFPFSINTENAAGKDDTTNVVTAKDVVSYLERVQDPEQVADLVSCAMLAGSDQRQEILETLEIEPRLRRLIHFLMTEAKKPKKKK
jgi:ATP-dependent Lon protease